MWVVKSGNQLEWFREQLSQAIEDTKQVQKAGLDVQVSISLYVTCDDAFTTKHSGDSQETRPSLQCQSEEFVSAPCSSSIKEKPQATVQEVEKESRQAARTAGHKNCCCRGDVDENDMDAPVCTCSCCGIEEIGGDDSSSSMTDIKKGGKGNALPLLHPQIKLYSGRPMIKDIMRSSLEHALGESAVVACGPRGLLQDVRHAAVSLSDERAVHKGTGAQGIWLHTEGFGY